MIYSLCYGYLLYKLYVNTVDEQHFNGKWMLQIWGAQTQEFF